MVYFKNVLYISKFIYVVVYEKNFKIEINLVSFIINYWKFDNMLLSNIYIYIYKF